MFHQKALYQWFETVRTHLPVLSSCQAQVLSLWSFGMVLSGCCGLTQVSHLLSGLLEQSPNTLRQRLREFSYAKEDKAGMKRQQLNVSCCFAPLLCWVLSVCSSSQLVLVLDATTLSDRFLILAVSVVYRGCAIPVAWKVLAANQKEAWRPHWITLLSSLQPAVPSDRQVLVMADRGLYARWLFRHIVSLGWHPFLRVNVRGTFQPRHGTSFVPFRTLVAHPETFWTGYGTAFKSKNAQLECTLLAYWRTGYKDPWLILTDLPASEADIGWYGMRSWIEQGFKCLKSAGWHWEKTRMTHPERAERFWLSLAVATLWVISNAETEHNNPSEELFPFGTITRRPLRLFRAGCQNILVGLITQQRRTKTNKTKKKGTRVQVQTRAA